TNNTIFNASLGLNLIATAGNSGVISQNVIRNCLGAGAAIATLGTGTLQFISNQFGECGIAAATPVISAQAVTDPNSILVLNNVYQGHANNLTFYVSSASHLNFVSGNAQTQTALGNSLP